MTLSPAQLALALDLASKLDFIDVALVERARVALATADEVAADELALFLGLNADELDAILRLSTRLASLPSQVVHVIDDHDSDAEAGWIEDLDFEDSDLDWMGDGLDFVDDDVHARTREIGRYRIGRKLGKGGMSVVYEALDTQLDRSVALKLLDAGMGRTRVARLQREARLAAQLSHPGIVTIHEVGSGVGRPTRLKFHYIAMDLIDGPTFDAARDEPLETWVEMFEQVADAVGHAHVHGVIHRDLKPANVLIRKQRPIVIDFGLAHAETEANLTRATQVIGTPYFMAPEQVAGAVEDFCPATDIWALGVMMYQLLTGDLPFKGSSVEKIQRRILEDDPKPPGQVARGIPRELEILCMRCLEKRISRRLENGAELAAELRRWRNGEPILSRAPSALYRLKKWIGRNKTLVASILVALMAAGAVAAHQRWEKSRERADEVAMARRDFEGIRYELRAAMAALEPLRGEEAPSLRQPNGEPDEAAAARWYAAHARVVRAVEELGELRRRAHLVELESSRVGWERTRLELCERVWRQAAELGHYNLARGWVDRAARGRRDSRWTQAREWITARQLARVEQTLDRARAALVAARKPEKRSAGWYEDALLLLLRLRSPELVQLLLSPEHLDSEHATERRLAIEAIGLIGDARTRGADGADPVTALTTRLGKLDLRADLEAAVQMATALGNLRDGRARAPLEQARWRAGELSAFWRRSEAALARIPVPAVPEIDATTAADLIARARSLEQRDRAAAIADYARALAIDRDAVEALVRRGRLLSLDGQHDRARHDLTRAIALQPKWKTAWLYRADARLASRDLRGAVADATHVLETLDDGNVVALHVRGRAYLGLRQIRRALADLELGVELEPGSGELLLSLGRAYERDGRPEPALAAYVEAIRLDRSASAYLHRAMLLWRQDKRAEALADLERAIGREPRNGALYRTRAQLRIDGGDLDGALTDLDRALLLDAKDALACDLRGQLRHRRGEYAEALRDFDRAVALDPRLARAFVNRGAMRARIGEHEQALADLGRAIELDAAEPLAYVNRAQVHVALGRAPRALSDLDRALALDPDHRHALDLRSTLREKAGELPGALSDAERLVRLDPEGGRALYLRGRARLLLSRRHRQQGKTARANEGLTAARADLAAAAAADAKMWRAWHDLGVACDEAAEPKAALQAFRRALAAGAPASRAGALRRRIRALEQQVGQKQ